MKDNKLENGSDGFLETKEKKVFFANKIENLKKELSILEGDQDSDNNLFSIIVNKLRESGDLIPNENIVDIRKKYINNSHYFIAEFNNNTFIMINEDKGEVLTGIGAEKYHMNNDEAREYSNKYLSYMRKFLNLKKELEDNPSLLAKIRLEKMGI